MADDSESDAMSYYGDYEPPPPTLPSVPVIIPTDWTLKRHSRAVLNGDCKSITKSRRDVSTLYTRLATADDAKYKGDLQSCIDLTLALIGTRFFRTHYRHNLPVEVRNSPEVARALVLDNVDAYMILSASARGHIDVIMTFIEKCLSSSRGVSQSLIELIPRGCAEQKEVMTAVIDMTATATNSAVAPTFNRLWRHFLNVEMTVEWCEGFVERLEWFEPLLMKAAGLIRDFRDMDSFIATYDFVKEVHANLRISSHIRESAIKKLLYDIVILMIGDGAKWVSSLTMQTLEMCAGDSDFLCYIAYVLPHMAGSCLVAAESSEVRFRLLDVAFKREDAAPELSFDQGVADVISLLGEPTNPRKPVLGDFVDVLVRIANNADSRVALNVWATPCNVGAFLSRFDMNFESLNRYDARSRRTDVVNFRAFQWSMVPSAWADNETFVHTVLNRVDPEVVIKIVQDHGISVNASLGMEGSLNVVDENHLSARRNGLVLPPDQDESTALHASVFTGSKDSFPWQNKAMAEAFKDSAFPYMKHAGAQFLNEKQKCATLFAYALLAHSDQIDACKSLISDNPLFISGNVLMSIIPKCVLDHINTDRDFFKSIFAAYNGIGPRLPARFRYETEFLMLTIEKHPNSISNYDAGRIRTNRKVVDAALAKGETVQWMFRNLTDEDKERITIVRDVMKDEKLSVDVRRSVLRDLVPEVVKTQKWCKKLATQLFGYSFTESGAMDVDDPVISKLSRIAHDNHSSQETNRASNTAYLRSLYMDIQTAYMPAKIAEICSIDPPRTDKMKTYVMALPERCFSEENRLENLTHAELKIRMEYLEEVAEAAAAITEPRRRDGRYPSSYFCENFEGVAVKLTWEEGTRTLKTLTGKKTVHIPQEWQEAFDSMPEHAPGFWGKLHAGYGQRTKTMMLKNGTLGVVNPGDGDEAKLKAMEAWEGVTIKVYGTFDANEITHGINPHVAGCPAFVELVVPTYCGGSQNEQSIISAHRASVAKGGLGVVFRDEEQPNKLISLDAHGYAENAQKIVNFLTRYPLQVLSTYMHAFEDEDEEEDKEEEVTQADTRARFNSTAAAVAANVAPAAKGKARKRVSSTSRKSSSKKQRTVLTSAPGAAASSSARPSTVPAQTPVVSTAAVAAAASSYYDEDDGEVSEVSMGEVSEVDGDASEVSDDEADDA